MAADASVSMPPNNDRASDEQLLPQNAADPRRCLLLIHGGGHKPPAAELRSLWYEALAAGLDRDHADAGGRRLLDTVDVHLVYYADLTAPLLARAGASLDLELDLEDRRRDLRRLAELTSTKKFRRVHYETLPGKSAVPELVADVAAPVLGALRLADPVLARKLPALADYLSTNSTSRDACEARLLAVLAPALARHDNVLLLSHAMGSVIGYDVLWRLSHESDHGAGNTRVRTWITFGSPLASEYVKRRLRGASEPVHRRYPNKIINWYNVAAEDDYYCHDKTVANDFAYLPRHQHLSRIRDFRIYNQAIRYGRSNPHNAVGYLIHPRMIRLLADWLTGNES